MVDLILSILLYAHVPNSVYALWNARRVARLKQRGKQGRETKIDIQSQRTASQSIVDDQIQEHISSGRDSGDFSAGRYRTTRQIAIHLRAGQRRSWPLFAQLSSHGTLAESSPSAVDKTHIGLVGDDDAQVAR